MDNPEQILFEVNEMASGFEYYKLGGISISPDNKWALFGVDTVSRRQYDLKLKNLETNAVVDLGISNTSGAAIWAADSFTFFLYFE